MLEGGRQSVGHDRAAGSRSVRSLPVEQLRVFAAEPVDDRPVIFGNPL
jgi:hypothetical protein